MSVRTTLTHLHFSVAAPEMSLDAALEVHTGHLVLAFLPMYQIILKVVFPTNKKLLCVTARGVRAVAYPIKC